MMKSITLNLFLFLFCFSLFNCNAYSEEEEMRKVSFQSISWNAQITNLWFLDNMGKRVNVLPLPHIRGKEVSTKLKSNLPFYGDQIDDEGRPVPVGNAYFTNETTKFLLLFKKVSDIEYKILAMPDDYESFPYGAFKIYNATTFNIGYKLNKRIYSLASMNTEVHKLEVGSENSTSVMIAFKSNEAEWKKGYANRWSFQSDTRSIIFVTEKLDAVGNKAVIVKRIKERQKKLP